MPEVIVSETLDCPIAKAWELVTDIESYPEKMNSVRSVVVREKNSDNWISDWVVELKESEMRWTEKETYYPSEHLIEFNQIDGDLESFTGSWKLTDQGLEKTLVTLTVNFSIGIPALEDMLNLVASDAIRENSEMMLKTLKLHDGPRKGAGC